MMIDKNEMDTRTLRFDLPAHLTYIVNMNGDVVGLEIMPWQDRPILSDNQDGAGEDWDENPDQELADTVYDKADANLWAIPWEFPEGVTWE